MIKDEELTMLKERLEKLEQRCEEIQKEREILKEKIAKEMRKEYLAKQILSELSGLDCYAPFEEHNKRIIFDDETTYQSEFQSLNAKELSELATGFYEAHGRFSIEDFYLLLKEWDRRLERRFG